MNYLNSYFENLGKLNFTAAKNNIKSILVEDNVSSLFELLNQIVILEKNYYHLIFITYKQSGLLGRKKQNESFIDAQIQLNEIKGGKKYTNSKNDSIINDLQIFLEHRCNMIEFYRSIATLKIKPFFKVSDCLPKLISTRNALKQENIPYERNSLDPILTTINLEIDILYGLLEAHEQTTNLYFLEPLNAMQAANNSFNRLEQLHRQSELSNLNLPLINWFRELNRFVLDKYTLYFHAILARYSILSIGHPQSPDSFPLVDKIRQFTSKQSICTATLLFDTTKQSHPYTGHGYALPRTHVEPLIGLQNYQSIFSTSATPLTQDELFFTVSLIREKLDNQNSKRIAHLIQTSASHKAISFFVSKIEIKTYLCLIFGTNKSEKDRQITSFINDICNDLIGIRTIELLRVE